MNKKFIFKGMAAVAVMAAMTSCSRETDLYQGETFNADSKANAESQLGVTIDPNQDWSMTARIEANVEVNLGLDEKYTVIIYDENPLFNEDAHYYTKTTVVDGGTASMSINVPSAATTFYAAIYDSKLRMAVKTAQVEEGAVNVTFGSKPAKTRATESEWTNSTPAYAKTMEDYLSPSLDFVKTVYSGSDQTAWMAYNARVNAVSVSEMRNYPRLSDNLIVNKTSNGNHTLSDLSWSYTPAAFPGEGDGKHFYVPSGVTINEVFHINAQQAVVNDAVIFIEGTVHMNNNTINGATIAVGNGGNLIIDGNTNFTNAGRFVVMAGGKITGNDGVELNVTNGAACYNAGTIQFKGQLNVNGSNCYNCGTIDVDVLRNTSGGTFTNFGSIKARTNMQAGDTYNSTVINGCFMDFTEDAGIGTLTMLNNSRLNVGGKAQTSGKVTLYNCSEINCGSLQVQNTSFAAPTTSGQFSVLKIANDIYAGWGGDFEASGNLYCDWGNADKGLYANGQWTDLDNEWSVYGIIKGKMSLLIKEETAPITIPAGDCTGTGYHPGEGGGNIVGTPAVWSYAYEDTPIGDYDMNDVVIKVNENAEDPNKLDVTLCCTGASLDLKVYLGEQVLFGNTEVHRVLGGQAGQFINTQSNGITKDFYTTTINKPAGFDFATADFWIDSPRVSGGVHVARAGEDPHGIVIPADWAWPTEYTCIKDAYPNFVEFAKNAATTDKAVKEWYKKTDSNPVAGTTWKK